VQPVAVAKRYARALADYAEGASTEDASGRRKPATEAGRLEAVAAELALVTSVLDADPKFRRFFADPSIPQKDKQTAIETLARDAKLSEALRNFLMLLASNRRLGAIGAIRGAFEEIKDERLQVVAAETTTAVPLSAADLKRLRETLERMTGRTVRITQRVDPALLGGARTRIGSRVYDGTLRRQLETLREKLIGTH
jgi:F-type H+-transporting ATPase subunit delta